MDRSQHRFVCKLRDAGGEPTQWPLAVYDLDDSWQLLALVRNETEAEALAEQHKACIFFSGPTS